jgi:fumarate hydratase class II
MPCGAGPVAIPAMTAPARPATRTETDSLGAVEVPIDALWGAQTERSRRHFAIGAERMPLAVIHAIARIKAAAAEANGELGRLDPVRADAIAAAAWRVASGEFDDVAFPLSVWQTGSGTQSHMNVNEVVARLATQALRAADAGAAPVHPNDEVNRGQSSNDVFPSAMHVAAVGAMPPLRSALSRLRAALRAQATHHAYRIKVGRTHLQDATPVTLGQEFGGHEAQLALAERAIDGALPAVHALAIGATAVGTGLNTHPQFGARVASRLAAQLGAPFSVASNPFAALSGHEALVGLHAALRMLALALHQSGNDIRLLGSGPRAGLGELRLPANEPGSSIMPGKVNPTQVEALVMVCLQVIGHDVAVGMAAASGQLELNVCKPLIALDVLDSQRLLADAMDSFAAHCVEGLEADDERMQSLLDRSLMTVTALTPHIGYERAAKIAQHAHRDGLSLREAAAAAGIDGAQFDAWADPRRMLGPA